MSLPFPASYRCEQTRSSGCSILRHSRASKIVWSVTDRSNPKLREEHPLHEWGGNRLWTCLMSALCILSGFPFGSTFEAAGAIILPVSLLTAPSYNMGNLAREP